MQGLVHPEIQKRRQKTGSIRGRNVSLLAVICDLLFSALVAAVVLDDPRDADVIARLQRRDKAALAELYDRYGRLVYSLILRIVRDRATAEDLVQEVFLRVWNRAATFDVSRGSPGPWLLIVARNYALDYLKSAEGRLWRSAGEVTEVTGASADAESGYLDAARVQQVRAAMNRLTPAQRQVLELAYFEGLSQSEMAERIQQPLGTVKTWVRTALKTLREELSAPAVAP